MQSASDPEPAERTGSPLKRKIAAIMAADVAGYTRLVAADEEGTLRALAAAREVFDARVRTGGGRIFNTAGDSVMCEFDSAVEAVRAAIDIQANLRARSADVPAIRRLEFRIGITIGDVVERDGDLLGDGVNIAARLESIAPPGGVCVSRSVHEAVANKVTAEFHETGPRKVKNHPQPIYAFIVPPPADRSPPPVEARSGERRLPQRARAAGRMAPPFAVGLVCGALALAASGAWTMRSTIMGMMTPDARTELKGEARPAGTRTAAADATPATAPTPASPTPSIATKPAAAPPRPVRVVGSVAAPTPDKPEVAKPETARPEAPRPDGSQARPALPADPALAFANLAKEGIVSDAKSLPELYHNARLLEARGDRSGALRAYAALAPNASDLVDPLMRYAALLRGRGGSAEAARQVFADLSRNPAARAAALVAADLAAPGDRRAALENYVSANPEMAPANQLLADDYLARPGGPTLTERRLAFDQLDAFLEAGNRAAFFVDRAMLDSWVDAARRRRSETEAFFNGAAAQVRAQFTRSEAGWSARLTLPEPATGVAYRIGERGEVVSAGPDPAGTAAAAKPVTSLVVTLPTGTPRTTLYLTYRDAAGRDAGPFPLPFDPAAAQVSSERDTLERYPDSWVSFRQDLPDLLSYAQLISNRCAIAKALIGFGDEPPRQALALPACSSGGATAMPDGRAVLTLPAGTDSVQMQIAYSDGTESPVRVFRRP